MKNHMPGFPTEEVKLTGKLAEFREALKEEIAEIEKSGSSSTILNAGRSINTNGAGFWYRFFVEYMTH